MLPAARRAASCPYGQTGPMGPSASSYDGSEKLPVGVCSGSICADELEENACLRHGMC